MQTRLFTSLQVRGRLFSYLTTLLLLLVAYAPSTFAQGCKKVSIETTSFESDCGNFSWKVRFKLDAPAGPNGGYIVQKVFLNTQRDPCTGRVESHRATYWEAWPVSAGQDTTCTSQPSGGGKPNWNDNFGYPAGKKTRGTAYWRGEVVYVENPAGGNAIDPAWPPGGCRYSGTLPSTKTQPGFWGGIPANCKSQRTFFYRWDCCTDSIVDIDTNIVNVVVVDEVPTDTIPRDTIAPPQDTIPNEIPHDGVGNEPPRDGIDGGGKIKIQSQQNGIRLYPNPTNGIVTIADHGKWMKAGVSVTIFNQLGQSIRQSQITDDGFHELDLSDQPPGYYLISLRNQQGEQVTRPIVKQ